MSDSNVSTTVSAHPVRRVILLGVVVATLAVGAIFFATGMFASTVRSPAASKAAVVSGAQRDAGPAAPPQGLAGAQLQSAAPASVAATGNIYAHPSAALAAAPAQAAADLAYLSAGRGPSVPAIAGQNSIALIHTPGRLAATAGSYPSANTGASALAAVPAQAAADLAYLSAGRGPAAPTISGQSSTALSEASASLAAAAGSYGSANTGQNSSALGDAAARLAAAAGSYPSANTGPAALPAASAQAQADLAYLGAGRGPATSGQNSSVLSDAAARLAGAAGSYPTTNTGPAASAGAPAQVEADLAYLSAGRGPSAVAAVPAAGGAGYTFADTTHLAASNFSPGRTQDRLTELTGSEERFFGPPASVSAVNGWTQVRGVPLKGDFAFRGSGITLRGSETQLTHASLDAYNNGSTWGEVSYTDATTGLVCSGSVTGKITNALATLTIVAPCRNGALIVGTVQDMSTDPPGVAPPRSVMSEFKGVLLAPANARLGSQAP